MSSRAKSLAIACFAILVGCTPDPALPAAPTPTPSPAPPLPATGLINPPETPALSPLGEGLIIEFEVGGRSGYRNRPEAPDARFSGITEGIGYDNSTNAPKAIVEDWRGLGARDAARLAATHPYTGKVAQAHLHEVLDIIVSWQEAIGVFDKIDVAREWSRAERAMPGFDALRPNCQAALISLGFNRGWSMTGDSRREMRAIRDAVPKGDYAEIAKQLRLMVRVWRGTEIYKGMARRRNAEADLVLKP